MATTVSTSAVKPVHSTGPAPGFEWDPYQERVEGEPDLALQNLILTTVLGALASIGLTFAGFVVLDASPDDIPNNGQFAVLLLGLAAFAIVTTLAIGSQARKRWRAFPPIS